MIVMMAVSVAERERRAARRAALLAVLLPVPYAIAGLLEFPFQPQAAAALVIFTAAAVVFLAVPTRADDPGRDTPGKRIDERDIMFSRRDLEPGTERFEEYYTRRPDNKKNDDRFRSKPGLLGKTSKAYEPAAFTTANANFQIVRQLGSATEGEPAPDTVEFDPAVITRFIEGWILKIGGVSAGVTLLKDYHLYTHVGRGSDYGKPVELQHKYAIVFTVEMDKEMVDCAPLGPTVMESAQQYLAAGVIAVQVAEFIRRLGYNARAHIDRDYRVVCPLVARDAGLGEIGRMGLLMTPELGPRVRIASVTTDLPLVVSERRHDHSMIDFCRICKKCADVCPPRAIPSQDRTEIDGADRWQIDQELCFAIWCVVGTDCARCVRSCPFSHPDNFLHRVVRAGVRRSKHFRKLALFLDDYFYGRNPPVADLPDWMPPGRDNHE